MPRRSVFVVAIVAAVGILTGTLIQPLGADPMQWAVYGLHSSSNNRGYAGTELGGVVGTATAESGNGVYGANPNGVATYGGGFTGVYGVTNADGGTGVYADAILTTVQTVALYAFAAGLAYAGWFDGRVHVNGTLSKSAGTFKIDHPLDPANKYLSHSFVESPDRKNIYDGVVTLDENGEATVVLPQWFEALNTDFRYQLTSIGEHAPVYIAQKIAGNSFRIAGGYAGQEISWQVTGSRRDLYALANPIRVEELKEPEHRGRFLHPELYHQSEAAAIRLNGGRPKNRGAGAGPYPLPR